jgi:hypothetical protein
MHLRVWMSSDLFYCMLVVSGLAFCVTNQGEGLHAELDATLGVSEPTLAEYIIAKHESAKGQIGEFRAILNADAGIDAVHVDRLHALIQTLTVSSETLCLVP